MTAQTRGKKTSALRHGGGPVREIAAEQVASALTVCGLPAEDTFVQEVRDYLCRQLIAIDAAPKVLRGSESQIVKIENAAKKLSEAIRGYPDWNEVCLSIQSDISHSSGYIPSAPELRRWLLRMASIRERYFEEYDPVPGYRATIAWLFSKIKDATAKKPPVSETSPFMRLLSELEGAANGLIFPSDTVASGRLRYVQNALKAVNDQITPQKRG